MIKDPVERFWQGYGLSEVVFQGHRESPRNSPLWICLNWGISNSDISTILISSSEKYKKFPHTLKQNYYKVYEQLQVDWQLVSRDSVSVNIMMPAF